MHYEILVFQRRLNCLYFDTLRAQGYHTSQHCLMTIKLQIFFPSAHEKCTAEALRVTFCVSGGRPIEKFRKSRSQNNRNHQWVCLVMGWMYAI